MIKVVPIDSLISHEEIDKKHVYEVMKKIQKCGYVRNPVIVEKKYLIILDGHHRVAALKRMNLQKIPAQLVSYHDKNIRVFLRRKNLLNECIKLAIIAYGKSRKIFPKKTTRHVVPKKIQNINVQLSILQ